MRVHRIVFALALGVVCTQTAHARTAIDSAAEIAVDASAGSTLSVPASPGHLECVPFARSTSGIQIYGDAHTWWNQAKDRYATGHAPRVGAVMAIQPFNNSRLGHVATVSRVVDARTVLLSHANWSAPGLIERDVTALDVSPNNDWSQVRIWYAPAGRLGNTHWPVSGFIYNTKPGTVSDLGAARLASAAKPAKTRKAGTQGARTRHIDPIGDIIAGTY